MRLSIKLGALCAAAALVPSILISTIVLSRVAARSRDVAAEQLQRDARAAATFYEKRLVEMSAAAARLADTIANRALVSTDSKDSNSTAAWSRLQDLLTHAQSDFSLDFITVADTTAKIIAQRPASDQSLVGAQDTNALAQRIIAGEDHPTASATVERDDRYTRLGLDRIVRVAGSPVDEALMIEAAAPVLRAGQPSGVVVLGQMLNVYYNPRPKSAAGFPSSLETPLVAEIKQSLYGNTSEDAGGLIALGNIIVASSIPLGGSATGASQPPLVGSSRDATKNQETLSYAGRTCTVAWQPIKSADGAEVGAIGVARPVSELEGPTGTLRALLVILGLITTVVAGGIGFLIGYSLATRIDDLSEAAARWGLGDLSAVARDRDPMVSRWIPGFIARDEISRLAERLGEMRESFRQAIGRMRKR